jgi:hypothetical protein
MKQRRPWQRRSRLSLAAFFSPVRALVPPPLPSSPQFTCADDGYKYVGAYAHGRRHGDGEILLPNGDRFRGQWSEGLLAGPVVYSFAEDSAWNNPVRARGRGCGGTGGVGRRSSRTRAAPTRALKHRTDEAAFSNPPPCASTSYRSARRISERCDREPRRCQLRLLVLSQFSWRVDVRLASRLPRASNSHYDT